METKTLKTQNRNYQPVPAQRIDRLERATQQSQVVRKLRTELAQERQHRRAWRTTTFLALIASVASQWQDVIDHWANVITTITGPFN